jgi:dTDP-4-amino-4,6-dideoxygalactose transaminase
MVKLLLSLGLEIYFGIQLKKKILIKMIKRFKIIPKFQNKFYYKEFFKSCFCLFQKKDWKRNFEKDFSKKTGIENCFSTYTGRSALIAILKSFNFKKGDEILLPGFTFIGLPKIINSLGLVPVFVDVEKYSLNINPNKIEEMISKKTKALLLVHNLGNPNKMDKILRICKKNNLKLIEDCAHTIGSEYKGKLLGTFGDASFFSFHYSKILNTFWGGMACTNDIIQGKKIKNNINKFKEQSFKQLSSRIFVCLAQSIVSSPLIYSTIFNWSNYLFKKIKGQDIIEHLYQLKPQDLSFHMYKFTDFQSIIGIEQLKKLDHLNHKRTKYYKIFKNQLNNKIQLQEQNHDGKFIPLFLTIFVKNKEFTIKELKKYRIEVKDFHITSITETKEFNNYRNNCVDAKQISSEILYFPTYHLQTEKDIRHIVKILNKVVNG